MVRVRRVFTAPLLTLAIGLALVTFDDGLRADGTPQLLPLSQDWNNTALITTLNDWGGVPGIIGYRGDGLAGATGVNPQTVLADGSLTPVSVLVNQTNPNTNTTGAVAEFELTDPVVALQGSGTARAPHIVINLDTTGHSSIRVRYNLRDIDGSADNAVQPVALQYRVGTTGTYTNVPAAFVADATTGPSAATLVTPVDVILPSAVDNQPVVQLRIITTDAVGSDEWVGIDDLRINEEVLPTPPTAVGAASPNILSRGSDTTLTVTVTPGQNPTSTAISVTADLTAIGGSAPQTFFDDGVDPDVTAGDNVFSYHATIPFSVSSGMKSLPVSVIDAQSRTASTTIDVIVTAVAIETLPFSQNWTNTALISVDNNWTLVPAIVGYRGDDLTTSTGVDPQTILADGSSTPVNVLANLVNPNATSTGAVAEFELPNPTIALQGSGTADAPHIVARLNTSGLGGIRVSYTLRDIDGSTDNAVQAVALQYRLGNAGPFTNVPDAFVADATTGPSTSTLVTPVSVLLPENAGNQPDLQLRWITTNASGNDEWVGIDDILVVEDNTPTDPTGIGAADPSTVPQGAATLLTVRTIPGRNPTSTGLTVTAQIDGSIVPFVDNGTNGDVTAGDGVFSFEYFVPPAAPTGPISLPVTVSDAQTRTTTTSIDFTIISPPPPPAFTIAQVQGSGSISPFDTQTVSVRGVVTGLKFNGFFIQSEEGTDDGDPATSEGIFVFTSSTPPPTVKLNRLVDVTGIVHEFVPSADPVQPPVTEITGPTVFLVSTGVAFPAPVVLTAANTLPGGGLEQLERFEGMRVQVESMTVTGPTLGSVNEPNATGSSNGVFYGVITGVARPFREPGIEIPNPLPDGAPLTVPRFDGNPERLQVDTNGQLGATGFEVAAGDVVTGIVGPLDYSFRTYLILPDPSAPPVVFHNTFPKGVKNPGPVGFTVGAANLERFFDTADDPGTGEPVLTPTAFANRLNKASLFIRDILKTPDILGVEEVENLTTLQALASKVNADAVANGDPDPQYQAFLEEGNDIGGIDLGALVKTSRLSVVDVTQVGKDSVYINPNNGQPELLNDRPSLIVRATVPNGAETFPVTVIVNHLRSLSGVEDPVDGNRVRTKRQKQAEELATLIQSRQAASPDEAIISVGDYNAFQFNDGLVDSIGTVKGTPASPDQVTLASPDLVNPDLVDLVEMAAPDQRYSFVFDGNAQELDHILVTGNLLPRFAGIDYGRSNADFPETARNDPNSPARTSDHDPVLAYFNLPPQQTLTAIASSANPSVFSKPVTFTATVSVPSTQTVPTGSVRFVIDGVSASTVALDINGRAQFTTADLAAGPRVIAAQFLGTDTLAPSEATLTQAVFLVPSITIDDLTVQEPDAGSTPANFIVRLSSPTFQAVTVKFLTANGTATAGSDFTFTAGTVTFNPGDVTRPIPVSILADAATELPQTFSVVLFTPTNATISDPVATGTILDKAAPRITSFTPAAGVTGNVVDIFGANFNSVLAVRFGSVFTTFTPISPTHLQARVPLGATDGPIVVSTILGSATSPTPFVVLPLIVGFTPASGAIGSPVLIVGTGMSAATSVRINGVTAPFAVFTSSGIDFVLASVPAGATSGPIQVTTPAGTAASATNFIVLP
jgi:predicted extracellular nuclease